MRIGHMKLDLVNLRSQLSPGWSPVNIGAVVILTWIFIPFGLAMIAYVLWGDRVGLDFSQPGSIRQFVTRLKNGFRGAVQGFNSTQGHANPPSTGTPTPDRDSFESWRRQEEVKLQNEREALEQERDAFNAKRNQHDKTS